MKKEFDEFIKKLKRHFNIVYKQRTGRKIDMMNRINKLAKEFKEKLK